MSRIAVITNASLNFLAHVRLLADSVRRHHPEVEFFAHFAIDRKGLPDDEPYHCLSMEDDCIPRGYGRLFVTPPKEFVVSLKPDLMMHMMDKGFDAVLYLDADMLLLSPIHDILEKVCSHSLTLTAHVWNPDSFLTDDAGREHLLTGIYNGGLIGATAAGRPFL